MTAVSEHRNTIFKEKETQHFMIKKPVSPH